MAALASFGLGCAFAAGGRDPKVAHAATLDGSAGNTRSTLCVVGEALIDFLPTKTAEGHSAYRWRPGGAPLNVCMAAARLGIPVTFLGTLSMDLFGEELYSTLERENVDMSLVDRAALPSTLAFVSCEPGGDPRYAFFKEGAADRSITARSVAASLRDRRFSVVHMSLGAITLEDRDVAEAFEEAFRIARASGGFASFDPNLRPPMIKGGPHAYRALLEAFLRSVDVVKASDADIHFLYGAEVDLEALANTWLSKGPKLVVVTRGPEGATAYLRDAVNGSLVSFSAAPPTTAPKTIDGQGRSTPVVDTVGAGDTCMGALLVGILGEDGGQPLVPQVSKGQAWDKAALNRLKTVLAKSVTCAAINCSRAGADPPTAKELDQALAATGQFA